MNNLTKIEKRYREFNKEIHIVLGWAFGDEGKGVVTQWLVERAIKEGKKPCVVRFSGGPQAAHTIRHGGFEHICSSFGSGVLLGVPTFIQGSNCFIDPASMKLEHDTLLSKGLKVDYPWIGQGVRIITPMDILSGRNNPKVRSDGTCGKGLYSTWKRYQDSHDLFESRGLYSFTSDSWKRVEEYYNEEWEDEDVKELWFKSLEEVRGVQDTVLSLTRGPGNHGCISSLIFLDEFDVIILEGSQGLLLDMEYGFYPNVTPSKTGLNGVANDIFGNPYLLKGSKVWLVSRTYLTRHGNGYEPLLSSHLDLKGKYETNVQNEFQGDFKTGLLEKDLLERAFDRHRLDYYSNVYNITFNAVLTHVDIIKDKFYYIQRGVGNNAEVKASSRDNVVQSILGDTIFSSFINEIYTNSSPESNLQKYEDSSFLRKF